MSTTTEHGALDKKSYELFGRPFAELNEFTQASVRRDLVRDAAEKLLEALKAALVSLRAWNVSGISNHVDRKVLADAYENSPEMKQIKAAIALAEPEATRKEQG